MHLDMYVHHKETLPDLKLGSCFASDCLHLETALSYVSKSV